MASNQVKPTLQTAKPIVAPNMSGDYQNIQNQFMQQYQAAEQFGRMNPDVVQAALASGGSLSNTLGFSSPTQILGLSPQDLAALTQGRGVNQQLNQATQNFDAITGGKENRDARRHLANQLFQSNTGMLREKTNNQIQVDSTNASRDQSTFNTQFSADSQSYEASLDRDFRAQENERNRVLQERGLEESIRHNRAVEFGQAEDRKIRASELKFWKDAKMSGTAQTGLPFDSDLQGHYTRQADYWSGIQGDSAALNGWTNQLYALSLGSPYNKTFDVKSTLASKHLSGATQLVLRPDGYYGTKVVNGKLQFVSNSPVLALPGQDPIKGKRADSGSVGKKYEYQPK